MTRILPFPIPLDHPAHPVNSLIAVESSFGISRAFAGLKQAVNDTLEGCEDLCPSEISRADASFASAGSITLTEAIRRRAKLYKAILKRGKIRNETEFHVVSALCSDTALDLPESEISILDSLVAAYDAARPDNAPKSSSAMAERARFPTTIWFETTPVTGSTWRSIGRFEADRRSVGIVDFVSPIDSQGVKSRLQVLEPAALAGSIETNSPAQSEHAFIDGVFAPRSNGYAAPPFRLPGSL